MFNIKYRLFFLFCLLSLGINAQSTSISGNISNVEEVPLAGITFTISKGDFTATTTTDEAGNYSIENIPSTENLTIQFDFMSINPLNGVSTLDYVLGARHILGRTPFDAAHQYIAMDINKSGSITAFDLVQLRQLILGITTEFSDNGAWRFIEKNQLEAITFSQANTPEYEGNISSDFNLTSGENTVIDLIGIKIGDANGSATTN